jgi:hypothetical protein
MHLDYIDIKRQSWDAPTLAALLNRLTVNGYQGLAAEGHRLVGRFTRVQGDRPLAAALAQAGGFADVLIPPAQPYARVILYLVEPGVLRLVVAGRDPAEVKRVTTATKMHVEAILGGTIDEVDASGDERDQVSRFRREVLSALNLTATGGLSVGIRDGAPMQLMVALRRQPAFRGRPTALGSQIATLLPDKPTVQARDAVEKLVSSGLVERLHVVVCRQGGQWLAVAPRGEEIRSFVGSNVTCPHCGTRVSEEVQDVAYRLTDAADAQLADNRPLCELLDAALRRAGAEAVAIDPGRGEVDGAAYYHGTALLFRARPAAKSGDVAKLLEHAQRLERQGWPVVALLVTDQSSSDLRQNGLFVVDNVTRLDGALEEILRTVRERHALLLLPQLVRPLAVAIADLLPPD